LRVRTGTLYLVGTPIGNLGDLTPRARDTLASVDLIAAEDTRRTGRLLAKLGIATKTLSMFEGNEAERTVVLLDALRSGRDVAVVADAGMPGLSDPGFRLVRACAEDGIDVRVVPGPAAAVAALVVSGLPTDRFSFEGFVPRRDGDRRARLASLANDPRTVVFFESPRRVVETLRAALELLGDRKLCLARELTKLHEEVVRGRISEVLARVADRELKGEVVLVLQGASVRSGSEVETLLPRVRALVSAGMRTRDAAHEVARAHGASANDLYRAFLVDLRRERDEADGGELVDLVGADDDERVWRAPRDRPRPV
jgi:16S rRNA (cytidine1402-2'-O)-methyltransferase